MKSSMSSLLSNWVLLCAVFEDPRPVPKFRIFAGELPRRLIIGGKGGMFDLPQKLICDLIRFDS